MKHCLSRVRILLLGFFLLFPTGLLLAAELSPAEERGKNLYFTGKSPSGEPIRAYFGEDRVEIPGEFATCGSCHGYDGLGRPESGVLPSNITWKYLTKSYGHNHPNGVQHPPFTEQSLKEYLVSGNFPGEGSGDPSMPAYDIPEQDFDDLVAFMTHLGSLLDPGLSDTGIRVGTFVPGEGRLGEIGQAMSRLIAAYFAEINQKGGIYGRKLELVSHSSPVGVDISADKLKTLIAGQDFFALVSTFTPGVDKEIQTALEAEDVPLIGPFTLYPLQSYALNRNTFSILPGLSEQVQGMVQYAHEVLALTTSRVAILYPETGQLDAVVERVELDCKKLGWEVAVKHSFTEHSFDADRLVAQTKAAGSGLIIFLGMEKQLLPFLAAAGHDAWSPYVMTPGILAGRAALDAPEIFDNRLYLAYPTTTGDRKDWGIAELTRLMRSYDLEPVHIQAQISAYASAKVLVEALRLSGRALSRRKFISVLEKIYKFDTGLTPVLSFTPNRRIGARGAYIVKLDADLRKQQGAPMSAEWIELK